MSFQSLNPELTAKVIFLANLQRNLMQNQNAINEKTMEGKNITPTSAGQQQQQQQFVHPLLMPSLNVSSQKISAMLAALTPSSVLNTSTTATNTAQSTSLTTSNNNSVNIRSNGSSFGWGNRERKMEENWRMQNRHI